VVGPAGTDRAIGLLIPKPPGHDSSLMLWSHMASRPARRIHPRAVRLVPSSVGGRNLCATTAAAEGDHGPAATSAA
jgi:hypothetical protein